MIYHDGKDHHWFEFPSALAFWNQADKPGSGGEGGDSTSDDAEWTGTKDLPEAKRLARYGWREGTRSFKPFAKKLGDRLGSMVRKETMLHDLTGEVADIPAYIQGQPESMLRLEPSIKAGRGRIVRVVYNVAVSGSVGKSVITTRGSVACAMIDAIAAAGYQVELVVCEWLEGRKSLGMVFPLKRADEPLNLERIAFCLAHPSFLRRMCFAVEETMPEKIRAAYQLGGRFGGSYGMPGDAPESMRGDIYFGQMRSDDPRWKDNDSAERAAIEMLQDAGVIEASTPSKKA